jgi:predicted RNA binding protein YcfA (HicA-like mRNA interferase family)
VKEEAHGQELYEGMKPQELVRILEADGWYSTGQAGSHQHFRHPYKPGLLIVPMHAGKEIGKGLLHSILKKAGLK